ncbi:MAG: hypothetical protein COU07_04005 [Candidatus Harrisonbacteria bacterium CG10_big_fil_rev_8_21_14_0_10_40_38]|uniref:ABC transporter n=1 Tax=Candidatus Harrisonbacteria bacterium CG10_big_fil_rev_8_21_14_0_10_40_38 TaxID=1974583 RepID=A0A2H0UTB5_9BACT|nr:MAG: hypothetical protein COU07_04005 [Candidatus Harrisonbacteria bacterium CG10_big_fil_rev_8_21_14_0_10_40_38]
MNDQVLQILSLGLMSLVAAASGLIGVFALTRRMTLAADAISHIALPGIGIALLLKIDPVIGAAVMLVAGAFVVWALEKKTKISTEAVIGILFTASLAIGSIIIPVEEDLLDALFGEAAIFNSLELALGIPLAIIIIFLVLKYKDKFTLSFISPDIARTSGLSVSKLDLLYLLLFVGTIVLGLKFLGALLMGSLIIVPAAVSRNIARSFSSDLLISLLVAVFSAFVGFVVAAHYGIATGPAIIMVAAGLFFVSVFFSE